MPRNGTGTYSLPEPPFVAGTTISSAAVNSDLSDIASALTGSLPRDGQAGMSGQFTATDGSVLLPSISFNNDGNTGFYRPGDDQVAVVVGGVQVALFNSTGLTSGIQIGMVFDFAGSTIPALYILCYGQNVSRVTYAALFAVIGTTYGSGDGVTTFGLPDLRGSIIYGKDNMGGVASSRLTTTYYGTDPTGLGNRGGSQNKTMLTANLPAYTPSGTIGITDPGHTHTLVNLSNSISVGTSAQAGAGPVGNFITSSSTTGISASFTGAAQGGSATPFALLAPGLIMNKIIFAGA